MQAGAHAGGHAGCARAERAPKVAAALQISCAGMGLLESPTQCSLGEMPSTTSWLEGKHDSPATMLAGVDSNGDGCRSLQPARQGQPGTGPPLAAGTPQRQSPWSAWLFRLLASRVHLHNSSCLVQGPVAPCAKPAGRPRGQGTACPHVPPSEGNESSKLCREVTWHRHSLLTCASILRRPAQQAADTAQPTACPHTPPAQGGH